MYSKRETALLKEAFWTGFGRYMAPVPSAEGEKLNWINYRTGVKDLYFRMEAEAGNATVAIVMTHTDPARQLLFFAQFKQLHKLLQTTLQEEWEWQPLLKENGKTVSKIYSSISGVQILNREDWPQIISFLKPRMMALDAFWAEAKYAFENL